MKILFSTLVFLLLVQSSTAQDFKVGIVASPSVAWSRFSPTTYTDAIGGTYRTRGNGLKLRGLVGFFIDKHIQDNFAFGFGANYLFSGAGYQYQYTRPGTATRVEERTVSLQYFQVPLYLKFVSNEIADRIVLYARMGVAPSVLASAKMEGERTYQLTPGGEVLKVRRDFKWYAADALVSLGIEYELNGDTKIFTGFTYNRGLTNIYRGQNLRNAISGFQWFTDFISLDVGIKF